MTTSTSTSGSGVSGFFLVFEGGDGAGKSTQVGLCAQVLEALGEKVVRTRQPGGTALGAQIRKLVLTPSDEHIDARCETLLMAADKAQHVAEVIAPALERGDVVLCDRYVDSMLAYQGAGRSVEGLSEIATWSVGGLLPDLTVVLDVDPHDAVSLKDDKDRMEGAGAEFHARVRQGFLDLAAQAPERYLVVEARLPREEICRRVVDAVRARRG